MDTVNIKEEESAAEVFYNLSLSRCRRILANGARCAKFARKHTGFCRTHTPNAVAGNDAVIAAKKMIVATERTLTRRLVKQQVIEKLLSGGLPNIKVRHLRADNGQSDYFISAWRIFKDFNLGVPSHFPGWFVAKVERYDLKQGEDYLNYDTIDPAGGYVHKMFSIKGALKMLEGVLKDINEGRAPYSKAIRPVYQALYDIIGKLNPDAEAAKRYTDNGVKLVKKNGNGPGSEGIIAEPLPIKEDITPHLEESIKKAEEKPIIPISVDRVKNSYFSTIVNDALDKKLDEFEGRLSQVLIEQGAVLKNHSTALAEIGSSLKSIEALLADLLGVWKG